MMRPILKSMEAWGVEYKESLGRRRKKSWRRLLYYSAPLTDGCPRFLMIASFILCFKSLPKHNIKC
jgi:hypothetical protein